MKIPTELFKDILLQVTDENQFKNLCKASSSVRTVCSKKYFLEELLKNLMIHDDYISYKVDNESYSVKELFRSHNLQKIQDDTEKYIKIDLDILDLEESDYYGGNPGPEKLYIFPDIPEVFYVINNLSKHNDFKIFIQELLGAINDGYDDVYNDIENGDSDIENGDSDIENGDSDSDIQDNMTELTI
jgi:hypothetical protein